VIFGIKSCTIYYILCLHESQGRLIAGISGSNPAGGIKIFLLSVLCVVGGDLQIVNISLCMITFNNDVERGWTRKERCSHDWHVTGTCQLQG
jgi:hypothetical protein